ncbi:hypothetical protein D3C78_1952110 [compost metagenome]
MPYCMAIGRKIGVQIRMVEAISMNVPSRNRMMLIIRKMTIGLVEMWLISSPVISATP